MNFHPPCDNSSALIDHLLSELSSEKDIGTSELDLNTSNVGVDEGLQSIEVVLEEESEMENNSKTFEDMSENELRNEFEKRNMKIGRIKKKTTFIDRLEAYEAKNKEYEEGCISTNQSSRFEIQKKEGKDYGKIALHYLFLFFIYQTNQFQTQFEYVY